MLLIYASRTNNIDRIVKKLNFKNSLKLITGDEIVNEEFVLLTYTDLIGQIPDLVVRFLKNNHQHLRGVAGSGNKNFGSNFCNAAISISKQFNVELLMKFELSGNEENINTFKEKFISLGGH